MKKVGYRPITPKVLAMRKPTCMSCGALATKQVTFRDDWCKLRIALCTKCASLEYEELNLQRTLQFPGVA